MLVYIGIALVGVNWFTVMYRLPFNWFMSNRDWRTEQTYNADWNVCICMACSLCYLNPLPMLADDTTRSIYSFNIDGLITSLSDDLSDVDQWCKASYMAINTAQSKFMITFLSSSPHETLSHSFVSWYLH